MELEFEEITNGLRFPEGPVCMLDGSIILVEIERGTLTRVSPSGEKSVITELGGGPNGAAVGPDGAMYICNNGGINFHDIDGLLLPGESNGKINGRIERVNLETGASEVLFDQCDGHPLIAPNDIVFDKNGGFYFTDHGKDIERSRRLGGLYYAKPDGSEIIEVDHGYYSPNGVGLSPDESKVYVADSYLGSLLKFDMIAPGKMQPDGLSIYNSTVISSLPKNRYCDSLAVTAGGKVCVATLGIGGITMISDDDVSEFFPFPDALVTNICFGGEDMRDAYLTFSLTGTLVKCRWPEPGLKLNFEA